MLHGLCPHIVASIPHSPCQSSHLPAPRTTTVPFCSEEFTPETWVTLPEPEELVRDTVFVTPDTLVVTLVEAVAGIPVPVTD